MVIHRFPSISTNFDEQFLLHADVIYLVNQGRRILNTYEVRAVGALQAGSLRNSRFGNLRYLMRFDARVFLGAQVANLLFRRLPIGRTSPST